MQISANVFQSFILEWEAGHFRIHMVTLKQNTRWAQGLFQWISKMVKAMLIYCVLLKCSMNCWNLVSSSCDPVLQTVNWRLEKTYQLKLNKCFFFKKPPEFPATFGNSLYVLGWCNSSRHGRPAPAWSGEERWGAVRSVLCCAVPCLSALMSLLEILCGVVQCVSMV